ncbi:MULTISPECIES: universal stress protein [Desulfococcus]|nr:universal stress protein [Desulfococcus multivorans]
MEKQMIILVAYDGSNAARDALELGLKHAEAFKGKVVLIRSLTGGSGKDSDDIQRAEDDLAYAERRCRERSLPCETHLLIRGLKPGEDIVRYAEECGADEIVMGVRRRSKVGKMLFGSNARYVIMEAACPVVTIK